ncbi:MAG TPA: hypothetical protein VK252_09585, partial [Solirubrobacteraceae bacterium]|nr:hypothetical protein [Solirubrobacteraceae bacterium]
GVMATQILVEQHVRELRAAAPATWNTLIAALTPLARRHVEPAFRLALGRELVQLLGPALEAAAPWLFEESQAFPLHEMEDDDDG